MASRSVGRSWDELREEAAVRRGGRKKSEASELESRIKAAWDSVAPSRHSRYDNLIPTWQRAIMRLGRVLLETE